MFLAAITAVLNSFAKDGPRLRLGVELEKELSKNIRLEIVPEIRLESKSMLEESLLEMGLNYKLHKYIDLAALYRISFQNENDNAFYRFAFDAKPNYSYEDFKIQYRFRFTNYTEFDMEATEKSNYLRNRLNLEYEWKKFDITPFVNTELFYWIEEKSYNKIRYGGGIEIKLNKNADMEIYYLYNKRRDKDKHHHIWGSTFKIEI